MRKKVIALLMGVSMFANSLSVVQAASIYEAEDAQSSQMNQQIPNGAGDYTGNGYLEPLNEESSVTFTVEAAAEGNYAVDLRYTNASGTEQPISIYVNGKYAAESTLPKTVSADTYGVQTVSLPLEKGSNTVEYRMKAYSASDVTSIEIKDVSTGPLYWMAYESPFEQDHYLEEERWDKNAEWLKEEGFVEAGYDMMSTDGWVEGGQLINEHGYITKYNWSWKKDWKEMGDQLKEKGIKLGIYYDPLWVTAAAYNSDAVIEGTDGIKVSSLVDTDYGHFSNFKAQDVPQSAEFAGKEWCKKGEPALYWLDTDKPGAEEYVKGYVKHFAEAGAVFLRVDFLGWYENGIAGDGKQNDKPAYGTKRYKKALKWMSEACQEYGVMLSLVMPNQYNHAENELEYGDMMRVNEDVANGGWDNSTRGPEKGWTNDHISGRRRGQWQPDWAQWGNTFDAFTGWADVGGRGQMILDGDFLRMARFDVVRTDEDTERKLEGDEIITADAQKRSAVSLVAMAGSPICIADQYDTMNENAPDGVDNKEYYLNEEILALNKAGFVGKPIRIGESERWAGQLPDGSWVVALFNRDRTMKTQKIDFLEDLGIEGNAQVRDLWKHEELGSTYEYSVDLAACDCVVLKITPDTVRYEAEVGSLRDGANSNENHDNFSGWGFVDKLESSKGDVLIAAAVSAGTHDVHIRYCNGADDAANAVLYVNGTKVKTLELSSTDDWNTWKTLTVSDVAFTGSGEDLVDVQCISQGGFNLDYIEIGEKGAEPAKKVHSRYEAEAAEIGDGAQINDNHQLASDRKFVDGLDQRNWTEEGKDDTVTFTVYVEEAGGYDLAFRYANGGTDASADIFVNDEKLGYFVFPTVYGGAWDTWGEVVLYEYQKGSQDGVAEHDVYLNAGENTITYKHGVNAINLDCLTITKHTEETETVKVNKITVTSDKGQNPVMKAGDTLKVTAEAGPANAENKKVTWSSSDESIAVVDATGVVTAKKAGTVTITAAATDGSGVKGSIEIQVQKEEIQKLPFDDVKEGEWYYDAVYGVFNKKLMTGMSEKIFGPAQTLNRGQFATILYRMAGSPEVQYEQRFNDVKDGEFYSDAVIWANNIKVITGYGNGYFGPSDNITREQMATMMYRYAKYQGKDVSVKGDLNQFPDGNKVAGFAKEGLEWCVGTGLIRENEQDSTISPQDEVVRAVCATIILRYVQEVGLE